MTAKGIFPALRFKEFKENWTLTTLGEISSNVMYGMNSAATDFDGINKYIRITDIDEVTGLYSPNPLTTPDGELDKSYKVDDGDILLARTGASVGKCYLYNKEDGNLFFAGFLIRFNINTANPYFIFSYTFRSKYKKWVQIMSMRSGQPGINAEEYKGLRIYVPKVDEQEKIGTFLKAIDDKLQSLIKKKDLLDYYKSGIVQSLFKEKVKFRDENGKSYPKWKEKKLSEVLNEHKNRSSGSEEVFSVSVHKGLVNQIEHLGRSFAAESTSHYNLVKPGDIVYTKSPTGDFPYGIIKQSKVNKNVIVSPLYGVFTPETPELGYMLNVYFESITNVYNYLHPIIQKGAKNTINITNETFLSRSLKLPVSKEEQKKIGEFLKAIDDKIMLVEKQIEGTKEFKKGLLQQMFV